MGWSGPPSDARRPVSYARRVPVPKSSSSSAVLAAIVDVLLVVLFVAIGRNNHDEGVAAAGVLETAAPFLIGLAVGWIAGRAFRRPTHIVTGAVLWISTVVVGMLLRKFAFDRGIALAFVIVATVFNLATLVGWRVVFTKLRKA
jgi:hypothetical protein